MQRWTSLDRDVRTARRAIVYSNIMQAARLFDLLVCYVLLAAYANARRPAYANRRFGLNACSQTRVSSSARRRILRLLHFSLSQLSIAQSSLGKSSIYLRIFACTLCTDAARRKRRNIKILCHVIYIFFCRKTKVSGNIKYLTMSP